MSDRGCGLGPAPRGRACGPSRSRRELLTQPNEGWVAHFEVGEGLGEGRRDAALLGRDPSSRRGTAALRELYCPALAGSWGDSAPQDLSACCVALTVVEVRAGRVRGDESLSLPSDMLDTQICGQAERQAL